MPHIANGVISIGSGAFEACSNLTSITIPGSVTNLGTAAFFHCTALTNVTIANGATSLGVLTFSECNALTSITIPNTVTSLESGVFNACTALTSITIPNSVTNIAGGAFIFCFNLKGVYFQGNAPTGAAGAGFDLDWNVTIYYLPGTTGWGTTLSGRPTSPWSLPNPLILNYEPTFGVQTNGFGFTISWATNRPVVVEASANLANPTWLPLVTNTLTSGSSYFSDPQWTNYPARFYRLRWP